MMFSVYAGGRLLFTDTLVRILHWLMHECEAKRVSKSDLVYVTASGKRYFVKPTRD
jgi:hypothetical protein